MGQGASFCRQLCIEHFCVDGSTNSKANLAELAILIPRKHCSSVGHKYGYSCIMDSCHRNPFLLSGYNINSGSNNATIPLLARGYLIRTMLQNLGDPPVRSLYITLRMSAKNCVRGKLTRFSLSLLSLRLGKESIANCTVRKHSDITMN